MFAPSVAIRNVEKQFYKCYIVNHVSRLQNIFMDKRRRTVIVSRYCVKMLVIIRDTSKLDEKWEIFMERKFLLSVNLHVFIYISFLSHHR